jgi:hypothetical protein
MEAMETKNLIGLVGENANFVGRARTFGREVRREVFRCLCILTELDKAFDCFAQDESETLRELCENWGKWHQAVLRPQTLEKSQQGVAERVTQQIEEILSEYLPARNPGEIAGTAAGGE